MKLRTIAVSFAVSLAVSSTSLAGGPPTGHWRMNANKEYPGDLFLVPVADHLCAYYRNDKDAAKPGGMTLKAEGDTVTGTWDEGQDTGKISWKLAGKKLDGSYTDSDGKDPAPWVASYVNAGPTIKLEKSYEIDWDGGNGKSTMKIKQTGNKVVATVEGRYSGDSDGTITGTLYGNVLAGVHELQRRGTDLLVGGGRLEVEQGLDAAAHRREVTAIAGGGDGRDPSRSRARGA
jgi:hypothetical protein